MFRQNNHFINSGRFLLQIRLNHMKRDDLYKVSEYSCKVLGLITHVHLEML